MMTFAKNRLSEASDDLSGLALALPCLALAFALALAVSKKAPTTSRVKG